MQSHYARQYENLWHRHWWWRARKQFVLSHLRRLASAAGRGEGGGRRILDIGCGNGLFFDELSAFGDVQGIEPDPQLVPDSSPHRARIQIRPFDNSYASPSPDQKPFDWILMLDVLEHIPDDRAAAKHVRSLLAPQGGGIFLLTVPALPVLWSQHDTANLHYRRYTKKSLRAVLAQAGFHVQTLRYFFTWPLPLMLARRALSPAAPKDARSASAAPEYHVRVPPPPVNAAMYALSRLEQAAPLGLPIGSSLLAIAS